MKIQGLILLLIINVVFTACSTKKDEDFDYQIVNENITVDGEADDWKSIGSVEVENQDNLWIGEGLPEGNWKGKKDLSFSFRIAHHNGKLFFLFIVKDDTISDFDQPNPWLNDCVEIHLDHQNLEGERIIGIGPDDSLKDRLGMRLKGHELQFLPSQPPKVFLDDTKSIYFTHVDQIQLFNKEWFGEISINRTSNGYLMELGFAIPNYYIQPGQILGLDVAICDDDGKGRKSLLIWSGFQGPFYVKMDDFKKAIIK
jgi:hypothetical protein